MNLFILYSFPATYYLLLFFVGLCVGSFLNVVIDRLPRGQSLLGRSRSDCCDQALSFLDLVPIFSFLFSRGRCRYCGQKISRYYPLVELLTGGLTVFTWVYFSVGPFLVSNYPLLIFTLVNIYFLIVYFFMDLKYGLVSVNVIAVNFVLLVAFYFFFWLRAQVTVNFLQLTTIFALGASLFLAFLILLTRGRGMGFGDVLMIFIFCLITGFPQSLVAVFLGFVFGGLVSALLLLLRQRKFGQTVPFGPFLVLGTLVSLFWGRPLLDFYFKLILK